MQEQTQQETPTTKQKLIAQCIYTLAILVSIYVLMHNPIISVFIK